MPNDIVKLLRNIADRLDAAGIASPYPEAEIILMTLLKTSRSDLYSAQITSLMGLDEIIERRCCHEPLQYILGEAPFMDLMLRVEPGVLIPRPETELLVERICREAPAGSSMCDVGTGSGAIALAVASERPDMEITAVDISQEACRIADDNRMRLGRENVRVIRSDLLEHVTGRFAVVAANLPYVTEEEYAALPCEVKAHEPVSALVSGIDGLDHIRRLVAMAPEYLEPGGMLIMEIGSGQATQVAALMNNFSRIEIIRDYNNLSRHVLGFRDIHPEL